MVDTDTEDPIAQPDLSTILPRHPMPISEFRRMRRPRHKYIAAGRRDHLLDGPGEHDGEAGRPATFGLTASELRDHARHLYRSGWAAEEIEQVLAIRRRAV